MTKPTAKTTSAASQAAPCNAEEPSPKRAKVATDVCDASNQGSSPASLIAWADLRPELLSHVARYVSPDTADMMNFLFCVGPKTAAIVRKTYLSGNDVYLRDCITTSGMTTSPLYTTDEKRRIRILAWMEFNDWKDRCEPKEEHTLTFGFKKDFWRNFMCHNLPQTGLAVFTPRNGREIVEKVRRNNELLTTYKKYRKFALEGFPIIVGIGDHRIKLGLPPASIGYLLESEEANAEGIVEVKFRRYVDLLFSSPLVFIGFGLDNVLQYHIEQGLLDVNDAVEGALRISGNLPLIVLASFSPDIRCFRYLLSRNDICLTKTIDNTGGYQLVHMISFMKNGPEFREHLGLLLDDPRINPNVFNDRGLSPLHCVCLAGMIDHEETTERAKLLLRFGADPSMKRGEFPTVIEALGQRIDSIEEEEEKEPYLEIMNMLQNYCDLETDGSTAPGGMNL